MLKPKVVVTDFVEPDLEWERARLAEAGIELAAHQLKHAPLEMLVEATRSADAIVVNMAPIGPSLIERWERCRLVIRHGVGYDNVDVDALSARGIRFAHVPDYCVEEMAEQAIALILAAARRIGFSRKLLERSIAKGQWDFEGIAPIFQLRGKTLGIVGCGRIGSRVYQKLASFGMQLLVCDPYMSERRRQRLGIEPVSLERVLRESDYLTLHAPLNDETRGLIDSVALSMMKPTACLINTARAGLIHRPALIDALRNGTIGGAALDVFDREPPAADDPLLAMDNVTLTPHIGWYSVEAEWDIRRKIVDQLLRFTAGEEPLHWVNRAATEKV